MNSTEFTFWLEGFLAGKQDLDEAQITRIKEMLNKIKEIPRVQRVTEYPPNYIPDMPNRPFNPTCDTAKKLLTDDKRRDQFI